MGSTRFFVAGIRELGDEAPLEPGDARKLVTVLRKADGASLEIVDSSGRIFDARLKTTARGAVAVLERERAAPAAPRMRVTLAQALPKGAKLDYVIEKATELGVASMLVFTCERTVAGSARDGKIERWSRVAESAARQCGRTDLMQIGGPVDFDALVRAVPSFACALVPWELAPQVKLRDALPAIVGDARNVLVIIGPEGGIADAEIAALARAGAHPISLGARILRTETAGLVAVSALLYACGDI